MSKYSRFHSNYRRKKVHKRLHDSVIFERDWVTIGGVQRLSKGQSAIYGDGNFIFTTSNISNPKRRHIGGSTIESFTYDDVKEIQETTDISSRPYISNDMRNYAYYGSCVEMVRSSIEGIILEFPGRMTGTSEEMDTTTPDSNGGPEVANVSGKVYCVSNPFKIDIHHSRADEIEIGPTTNVLRYMCLSKEKYVAGQNGSLSDVTAFSVVYDDVKCFPLRGVWYKFGTVTINGIILYICRKGTEIAYFSPNSNFSIQPKTEVIEEYFSKLEGFEAVLLNRDSRPLYTNVLVTPIMGDLDYKYVDRIYRWPSNEGFIDIESPQFYSFLNNMIETATAFDNEWTDNLYSRMTHEAIKRYDTTFDRSYTEGDAEDMIEGGERMGKVIRIMGSVFDDIKRSADGIKRTNDVKYGSLDDGMDIDTVDDKLELLGWEIYSTIPECKPKDGEETCTTGVDVLEPEHVKTWYPSRQFDYINSTDVDNEFRKRLLLSAKHINKSKGTIHSIEMILGLLGLSMGRDFKIEEAYRTLDSEPLPYEDTLSVMEELKPYCDFDDDGESEFPGIPLKAIINKNGVDVVIPFYESNKEYADPNFYYQGKGGWGENLNEEENQYAETMNYLRVVSDFGDLLHLDAIDLEEGMIFYVVNLASYIEDAEIDSLDGLDSLDHFFICRNPYSPNIVASWDNGSQLDEDSNEYKKCQYLNSVINTSLGNNPHVGYGNYDKGEYFFETMQTPFKYALEYKLNEETLRNKADITFNIKPEFTKERIETIGNEEFYKDDKIIIESENYIYNDKNFIITFIVPTNYTDDYKKYIKEVIVPYLTQVIPSTTILRYKYE